jgi:hypothetical protein
MKQAFIIANKNFKKRISLILDLLGNCVDIA